MRQGGGGNSQMRADIADSQSVLPRFDKQAEDRQAGIVPEGGDNRVALDLVLSRLLRVVSDSTGQEGSPPLPSE